MPVLSDFLPAAIYRKEERLESPFVSSCSTSIVILIFSVVSESILDMRHDSYSSPGLLGVVMLHVVPIAEHAKYLKVI